MISYRANAIKLNATVEELEKVAIGLRRKIEELKSSCMSTTAILSRTNKGLMPFEMALSEAKIPYHYVKSSLDIFHNPR